MERLRSLATALSGDEVVKCFDLRIEQREGSLPVDTVRAERRSLARGHRLEEIRAIGTTTLLIVSGADRLLAHCRPAKASRGEIRELTAIGYLGPGGYRWVDQKCEGKDENAQHERRSGRL